jgi:hypothetical protein
VRGVAQRRRLRAQGPVSVVTARIPSGHPVTRAPAPLLPAG